MAIYRLFLIAFTLLVPYSAWSGSPTIDDAFSPDQGAMGLVIKTIGQAKKSVRVAAYTFTSWQVAKALVAAHERGVEVRMVFDKSQRKKRYGHRTMLRFLRKNDIGVRICDRFAIMHDKFIIIDEDTLEMGSFNYTRSAESSNAENILVVHNDPKVIGDYIRQWEKLWAISDS